MEKGILTVQMSVEVEGHTLLLGGDSTALLNFFYYDKLLCGAWGKGSSPLCARLSR